MIDWSARAAAIFRPISKEGPSKPTEPAHSVPEEVDASVLAVPLGKEGPKSNPRDEPLPSVLAVPLGNGGSKSRSPVGEVSAVLAVPIGKEGRKNDPFSTLADRVEAFEERAAIIEFEGGASRRSAEAHAEKLLGILAHREAWSTSDLEDGRDAITRNPEAASALFLEMLPRLFEDKDYRVICLDCAHNRHGRCTRHHQAGLSSAVIGPELAMLPQNCAAYQHIASAGGKQ